MSVIEAMETAETAIIPGKGVMSIMGKDGDTKLMWDRNNREETDNARDTFRRMRDKGFTAYLVKKDGEKGSLITAFDPDAQAIILAPRMVGG